LLAHSQLKNQPDISCEIPHYDAEIDSGIFLCAIQEREDLYKLLLNAYMKLN